MGRILTAYVTDEEKQLAEQIRTTMYRYDQLPQHRVRTLADVTDADVKFFWDHGYLVVDQVYNSQEIEQAIAAIMDIMFGRVSGPQVQFVKPRSELHTEEELELAVRKVAAFVEHEPRLDQLAHQPELLAVLTRLFADKPLLVQDMAILKPPSGGVEKPWHQDMAYGPLTFEKPVIGFWSALDAATLDNGCMHVIPSSHMEGPTPHYTVRDWQICDRNIRVQDDVVVPLAPGGALFFHGMLHHGTPPNLSTARRRAVQFHYAPEDAAKITPKEYKRWFTNEMSRAEC